ncbi:MULTISPECIES: nitroreductase [unclassified Marinobacter]|jgi:nitroreductase|uniref:nitroreductase family protein n=1 Tax=unclassified Marinobacter TaxID=83889 RepID=UPI00200D36D7|nr:MULTISPECIES: nitroreductase [unclassified Marinobacter]UQG57807.1 nitroreductase [Marinobacter sp. M4C]UQG66612.1 nitroreductase [Marinobacter sp. M2C]UQG70892.1 nitroreductase [Marinobacter sp. M1C]
MTAISDFILARSSEPRLQAPAPGPDVLAQAFSCAARAPDHGLLRPWRYLVVEGEGLERLGDLFADTYDPEADEKTLAKLRKSPLRAPMVIIAIASPVEHPKIPASEQVLSAAAGTTLLELALQDAGFGVMWRTGSPAYNPAVTRALGLSEQESVIGFIYTGSVVCAKPAVPRLEPGAFVSRWPQ